MYESEPPLEQSIPIERKIFECEKCGKVFNKKDHIKTHFEQVHLKKKKMCITCKQKFHPLGLKRHQRENCMGSIKKIECTICGKMFTREEHRKKHKEQFHQQIDLIWIVEANNEAELHNDLWCIEQL